jgi:hypothetical protein
VLEKQGKLRRLWSSRRPGPGRWTGGGEFLPDGAIPANREPPHVSVVEKICFQEVLQVFSSAHRVALGAGALRNNQLTGLIRANNHVSSIFHQPFVRCFLFLSQGLLLPGMNSLSIRFLADRVTTGCFFIFSSSGFLRVPSFPAGPKEPDIKILIKKGE